MDNIRTIVLHVNERINQNTMNDTICRIEESSGKIISIHPISCNSKIDVLIVYSIPKKSSDE